MTHHAFPGLRADTLLTYLAALGLIRIVADEDPELRTWWQGDHLHMETAVDDICAVLVDTYRPTPAFSPWNGGSGYGEKDRKQRAAIDKVIGSASPRVSDFADAHRVITEVLAKRDADTQVWSKERLIIELRNRVPVTALRWLDAVVVVGGDKLHFPSVYGTGGNDGRLEFSSNFHQRLADVMPEAGAKRAQSVGWATDALNGTTTTPLMKAPAGQFDPLGGGSPGTWAVGSGQSLVNPWLFVLMIEACGYLAASLTRAGQGQPRASVPFTVTASATGSTAGSAAEESRGEFWAPLWGEALQHRELRQLFEQAKASWAGRLPTTAAGMYAAAKSSGVDARITVFARYAIAQRNGLAFVGTLRDRVVVEPRRGIDIALPIDARMSRFTRSTSRRANEQIRALEACQVAFLSADDDRVAAARLIDWLAALTGREYSAGISERERDAITSVPRLPRAADAAVPLERWLAERAEHRLGASLASGYVDESEDRRARLTMHDLVIGRAPGPGRQGWRAPVVRGYGARPLDAVLADVAVWRDHHATGPARGAGRGVRLLSGHRYLCRRDDVTRWIRGELNERDVADAFAACLSLDWDGWPRGGRSPEPDAPDPIFAVLAAVASGQIIRPGYANDDADPEARQAWPNGWTLRLRAGRIQDVVTEAAALTRRSRFVPSRVNPADTASSASSERRHDERRFDPMTPFAPTMDSRLGVRLTAALLTPVSVGHLERLSRLAARGKKDTFVTESSEQGVLP